jgi:hypothetical protein
MEAFSPLATARVANDGAVIGILNTWGKKPEPAASRRADSNPAGRADVRHVGEKPGNTGEIG